VYAAYHQLKVNYNNNDQILKSTVWSVTDVVNVTVFNAVVRHQVHVVHRLEVNVELMVGQKERVVLVHISNRPVKVVILREEL
jgi:hypothetical protein